MGRSEAEKGLNTKAWDVDTGEEEVAGVQGSPYCAQERGVCHDHM